MEDEKNHTINKLNSNRSEINRLRNQQAHTESLLHTTAADAQNQSNTHRRALQEAQAAAVQSAQNTANQALQAATAQAAQAAATQAVQAAAGNYNLDIANIIRNAVEQAMAGIANEIARLRRQYAQIQQNVR